MTTAEFERAKQLQSQGPDEYPWGFYLHLARQQLEEEACRN